MQVGADQELVIQLQRQRQGDQFACIGAKGVRQFVIDPIAHVAHPLGRQQVRGVKALRAGRAHPARHRLASALASLTERSRCSA